LRQPIESGECGFNDYHKIMRQHGFKLSMSGKGNCYDNAAVETFFKTIKAELIWRQSWETRRQAGMAIFEYINGFYNVDQAWHPFWWLIEYIGRPKNSAPGATCLGPSSPNASLSNQVNQRRPLQSTDLFNSIFGWCGWLLHHPASQCAIVQLS